MKINIIFRIFLVISFLSVGSLARAGQLTIGAQYDGWNAINSTTVDSGTELLIPLSTYFKVNNDLGFYGQTEFANGNYTYGSTQTLTAFSDSVAGSDLHFLSFGLPSVASLAVNIPTGDQSWETKEAFSNIPEEFIDTRYRGRAWGASAIYALSFQDGKTSQFGAALGYFYTSAFIPTPGFANLNLGDSVYLGLNRIETFDGNKFSAIRLSVLRFFPTYQGGVATFQMGPNIDASYGFTDPKGFSYEIGAEFFTPAGRPLTSGGTLQTEPHDSFGQRFYLAPSLALGNLVLAGLVKYITPNDYPTVSTTYDGGGVLLGLNPTYVAPLDAASDLKFNAGYNYIIYHNMGDNYTADLDYSFWSVGTNYELKI
jgi:hypothetical protein